MGNYVILDDVNEYNESVVKIENKNNYNIKKYLLIGIVILFVGFIIFFIFKSNNINRFSSYEDEMVNSAMDYVKHNGITANKEMYIEVSKLNVSLPDSCSLLSGVIYDGNNYRPYLVCQNYESKIVDNKTNNKSDFKLVGNDVIVLLKDMEYYELGYTGTLEVNTSTINITGEGVYNVYYISKNSSDVYMRKVIVIDNPSLFRYFPSINIDNENPVIIEKGSKYDKAISAIDSVDGTITDIIKVSNLDEQISGEYSVIYSVRNSMGYTTSVMQKVIVVDQNSSITNIATSISNENITNESVIVNVSITGGNYNYAKLPDGSTTKEREFEYLVEENGDYEFIAVNTDGMETNKILSIDNIDKTVPTGLCKASIYYNKVETSVYVTSFNYIVEYNYYINGVDSGTFTAKSSVIDFNDANSVYVILKDYIGNEGKVVCSTENVSNFDPTGIHTLIEKGKPRLHTAIGTALANKGYTVNDLNKCISDRVKEAGPYTRYGVAAAAYGLIDCTYKMTGTVLPYNHTSGKVWVDADGTDYCKFNSDICGKLGVSTRWGSPGGSCGKNADGTSKQCWHGLNCATFVRWAMCNGGMDLCSRGSAGAGGMTSKEFFPEADGVGIKGTKVTYYSGNNLTNYSADTLVRMLKPGDAVSSSEGDGHTFVVVGYDNNGIYTAEDGYYMRYIKYSVLTNGSESYRLLFLDNYYANPKNRNNLYN